MRITIPLNAILAVAMMCAPAAAQARDWRHVMTVQNAATGEDVAVMFVDIDSFDRKPGQFPRGRALIVLKHVTRVDFAALDALYEVDCTAHRRRGVESFVRDADGKVLLTTGQEHDWKVTNTEDWFDLEYAICGFRKAYGETSYGAGLPIAEGRAILGMAKP